MKAIALFAGIASAFNIESVLDIDMPFDLETAMELVNPSKTTTDEDSALQTILNASKMDQMKPFEEMTFDQFEILDATSQFNKFREEEYTRHELQTEFTRLQVQNEMIKDLIVQVQQ